MRIFTMSFKSTLLGYFFKPAQNDELDGESSDSEECS